MTDLYRLLPEEMEKMVIDMGYDRYRADQILMPLYYKFPKNIADIKQLPKEMIAKLVDAGYTIGLAKEIHSITSDDGEIPQRHYLISLMTNLLKQFSCNMNQKRLEDFQDQQCVFLHKLDVQWDVHFVQQDKWVLKQI